MSKKQLYTWDDKKIVDDVAFQEKDAEMFRSLLNRGAEESSESAPIVPGAIVRGRIVEITDSVVVIDVGQKSEGVVAIQQFSNPTDVFLDAEVEVLFDQAEDEHGQIVLSREKAEHLRQWEHILNHCEEGSIIKGKVLRKVKGGLMVDIGKMEAFLPGSQIDNKRIKNLDDYIGQTYDFKILKINKDRKNIVVSRRELLEAERISKKAEVLEHIQPGDVREGVVKNITDFGVFLDLDGIDGLLHITDMAWTRIRHPSQMVQMGQRLEVVILSVDKEKGRVALGLKQKEPNPWEGIEEKYPIGSVHGGTVVNTAPYGVFVELEPGIEGLVHISEMSWTKHVTDPSEIVKKGQSVKVMVLAIQREEGKISLGIKQTEHNPWENAVENYPVGKVIEAEVSGVTNYGVFVHLEPGIEGLIHSSDLTWLKKVPHPSECLKKGDMVKAMVLSVDKESKKINLGIKQLTENPWEAIQESLPPGSSVKGTVTRIAAFGVFVSLSGGVEGLIHVTELSDKPFSKVEDIVSVGDEITAKVIQVDPENKKIALSMKEVVIDKNQYNHDDIVVAPAGKGGKSRKKGKHADSDDFSDEE